MQARKILEIHQAIKVLNQNFVFVQKDSKDKFEILSDQQRSNSEQVMMQIKDLKKHFKGSSDILDNGGDRDRSGSPGPRNRDS